MTKPLAVWRADPDVDVVEDTIAAVLDRAVGSAPDAVAVVDGTPGPAERPRWTYRELHDRAEHIASGLVERFDVGERLAVWAPTSPESLVLTYAAARAGVVLVPVNPALRAREIAHVLGQSGAAGLVVAPRWRDHDARATLESVRDTLPALREVVSIDRLDEWHPSASRRAFPAVTTDDTAQIVYTSGTTGAPKGARLTHRGMTNAARFGARRFGIVEGDVYVDPLPLFHVGGQVVALEIAHQRATMVMVSTFDAATILDLLEQERATLTVAVPTMLVALLAQPDLAKRDLSNLRTVSSGGAVVPADLVRRVRREFAAAVTIVFGQTECCGFISQTHLDDPPDVVAETLGSPIDGIDVRVVDPDTGNVVAVGDVGELEVRGYNVMAGYHDNPDATAAAIRDGWLRTGDLVTLDKSGYLRIVGRLKDMIVTGGVNVYAAEVEAVLLEHPAVAEAAVFGVPDDHWGERVVAAVRTTTDTDADTLAAFLDERLARFKLPKDWVFVDAMPITPSGKIQKFLLRDRVRPV